jgi:hypothetical protein
MAGIFDILMNGSGQSNDNGLLELIRQSQMTPLQSFATALPAYGYAKKANKYYQPAMDTLGAMGDPNSAQYQNIYRQQKQQGQDNLVEVIAEAARQNRKASAMGRTPLFSQERGGEDIFRNITRGYQDVQGQAANQTQDILGNLFRGQASMGATKAANAAKQSSVKGNIFGAVAKIFGL